MELLKNMKSIRQFNTLIFVNFQSLFATSSASILSLADKLEARKKPAIKR